MTRKRYKQAWVDLGLCISNASLTLQADGLFRIQGTDCGGHKTNMLLAPPKAIVLVECLSKWLAEASVDPRQPNILQD